MKKHTKKLFAIMLMLAVISPIGYHSIVSAVTGANPLTFTIGNADANPGDTITLPVTIANNPGLSNVGFHIVYNEDALKLTAWGDSADTSLMPVDELSNVQMNMLSLYNDENTGFTGGVLTKLQVNIKDGIQPGDYQISIAFNAPLDGVVDADGNDVDKNFIVVNPGNIHVKGDIISTPMPVTNTPAQAPNTPTPITNLPSPVTNTPTPITNSPSPVTNTPTPGGSISVLPPPNIISDGSSTSPAQPPINGFASTAPTDGQKLPSTTISLTIESKVYTKNGVSYTSDVAPYISEDRTMVPIRLIAEAFNAEVTWEAVSRTVAIKQGDKTISVVINRLLPDNMGQAVIQNARTLVPLRFVSENLGAKVTWYESTRIIEIVK